MTIKIYDELAKMTKEMMNESYNTKEFEKMIEKKKTKVCSRKNGQHGKKVNIWLNTKSINKVEELSRFYGEVLEREVSKSVIVRRAIALLLGYVEDIKAKNKLRDYHNEAIKIMNHR